MTLLKEIRAKISKILILIDSESALKLLL